MTPEVISQFWELLTPWLTGAGAVALTTIGGGALWLFRTARRATLVELEHSKAVADVARIKKTLYGEEGTNGLNGRVSDIEKDMQHGSKRMDELSTDLKDLNKKTEGIGKSMDKGFLTLTQSVAELKGLLSK